MSPTPSPLHASPPPGDGGSLTDKLRLRPAPSTRPSMADYESDLTRFIRELKSKRPEIERK
jgi:hypothetical protein